MVRKKKFGLIWSYILKVTNFIIFRDFLEFFQIYFGFIWPFKSKKIKFLSWADMAADAAVE